MGDGARCVTSQNRLIMLTTFQGLVDIGKTAPNFSSIVELTAFRKQMTDALQNVRLGGPSMGTSALRRLLLRATAVLISSPVVSAFNEKVILPYTGKYSLDRTRHLALPSRSSSTNVYRPRHRRGRRRMDLARCRTTGYRGRPIV